MAAGVPAEHIHIERFGIPVDKVTEMLAKYLPTAVDKATPDGKLPS